MTWRLIMLLVVTLIVYDCTEVCHCHRPKSEELKVNVRYVP